MWSNCTIPLSSTAVEVNSLGTMIKSNKERLTQNSLLGSVLCPYCSHGISSPEEYDYQPNRIMQSIRPPFSIAKTTKNTNLGFYKLLKAQFQALDFDIFLEEHNPGRTPVKHIRGWLCQLWCVLGIIVNNLASSAESTTAHPNEMSATAYFVPRAMSTRSKCINSRCSCARRWMGCS